MFDSLFLQILATALVGPETLFEKNRDCMQEATVLMCKEDGRKGCRNHTIWQLLDASGTCGVAGDSYQGARR